jgi:diguanylate cyclase (GGDEF)-like protein
MKAGRNPTIRSRLILLVIACVIPASVMAVVLISYNYQREQGRLVRDSIATARAMGQAIDRQLSSTIRAAEILSTSPPLQNGDIRAFYAQASSAVRLEVGNNIVLSDAGGQQLVNTLKPPGDPLPLHGNAAQLHRVFATARPVISDIYLDGLLQRPVMSVDVPVLNDGKVVYDLSVGILPERFAKILVDQHLPPDWIATVFDTTGTIAARTHEMDRLAGKKGAPALIQRMTEINEDALETTSLEGISVLSVFSKSSVSNWTVAIGIPTRELTGELRRLLWSISLGVALLLAISLALAWAIGGRIARSVHGLTDPALALGFGGEVTVPPLHLKEADEVGQALMKASKMLHEAQHQAHHDALTGLANRSLFDELLDQQLAICRRTGAQLAILYVDLDGFKAVNDAHGHATGDELLRAVTARLKAEIRPSDVAARLGGDEFALVLINCGMDGARVVARELANNLSMPYSIETLTLNVTASIGIASYPESGTRREELLRTADEAMYKSKPDRERRM